MCNFCEKEKTIFKDEVFYPNGFLGNPTMNEIYELTDEIGVFIDTRGYLRFARLDDCQCLDHGEKIKISYCPFCGNMIKQSC